MPRMGKTSMLLRKRSGVWAWWPQALGRRGTALPEWIRESTHSARWIRAQWGVSHSLSSGPQIWWRHTESTMRWGGALKEGLAPSSRSTSTQSPRAHPFLLLPCHLFSPSPFPCHSFSLSLSVSLCVSVSLFSICLPDSLSLLISISLSLLPFSVCLCLSPIHLCPEHATTSASSHTSCSHSQPPTSPHPTQALALQAPSPLLTCQEFLVLLAPESGGSCV